MRRVPLVILPLIALALLLSAAPLAAAQTQSVPLLLDDDGSGEFFFRLPDEPARNPTIRVGAGSTVVFFLENDGTTGHSFHVGAPVDRETRCCLEPGQQERLEVPIPADAPETIRYWCTVHLDEGMEGILQVQPGGAVPRIVIETPAAEAVVPPEFTVRVRVEGFDLGTDGHIHYTVNGTEGLPGWDGENTTFKVRAVGRDYHLVRAELVGPDHRPLDPPVFDERLVFVSPNAPPEEDPAAATPTPADDATLDDEEDDGFLGIPGPGVALALAGAGLSARVLRRRARP